MNTEALNAFLLGGIATLTFVAGLFFLRYWCSTRDTFFLFFMLSFWVEAANRVHMALTSSWSEDSASHCSVRLLSYGLILLAILDKDRPRSK